VFEQIRQTWGAAIIPDYSYAFFDLPLAELDIWGQFEGTLLGALLAIVGSWGIAVWIKQDWRELTTGVALAAGSFALDRIINAFEPDIAATLDAYLAVSTGLVMSLLLPTIIIGGYALVIDRWRGRQPCPSCGEVDLPGHARFCPVCGTARVRL
jgi:hypothetical protein